MIKICRGSLHGLRDDSILSLGFSAALRGSEIRNLMVKDLLNQCDKGVTVIIRRSKTDQEGRGQRIPIPEGNTIKPLEHLRRWLNFSKIEKGYLFQTLLKGGIPSGKPVDSGEVARIIKLYTKRIGLNPNDYSGHSLRAGFVTSAAVHHARIDKIMEVTRHKSAESVMKYIRDEDSFSDHAGASFL